MASLTEAYARVRETTARNNAAREEDGGILQEVFTGILGELNNDLDPANVDRPLSPMGELLDSVTDFKQRQIEKAAEIKARLDQAAFIAGAPVRAQAFDETRAARLVSEAASRADISKAVLDRNLHNLQVGKKSDKAFIRNAVENDSSLAKIIIERNAAGKQHLFQVLPEDAKAEIEDGELIYTHPTTGQQLYSTGSTNAKNLNYAHNRLSKVFFENLISNGFSEKEILKLTSEQRIELFQNRKFKAAMESTIINISPRLLESHEIYNQEIEKHTQAMTLRLDKRIIAINRAIVTQQQTVQKHLLTRAPRRETLAQEALDEIERLEESLFGLQVGGNYQRAVNAEITKIAFALSLMKKEKVTAGRAAVNIQAAIQIARNSGKLKDYKRAHEAYYSAGLEKIRAGVTKKPPPAPPVTDSGKPAVPKKATATSERVPTKEVDK
jgi:hypothetical protein